jgi:putative serine protease PepD
MSEDTPASTGDETNPPPTEEPTQPPEQPTQPTEAATAAPAQKRDPIQVPRWAAGVVAAVLLLAVGFGIGWIAAPGGGDHDHRPIGRVFPGFPGRQGGPRGGPGSSNGQGPSASSGAFLGVSTQAPSSGQQGVPIAAVQPGSAADQAGLKAGDLITAVDSNSVTAPAQLSQDIRSHQPGDQVTVTYTRNGTSAQAQVKLGTSAPTPSG